MPVTPNSIVTPQAPKSAAVNLPSGATNSTYTTNPTNAVQLLQAGANGARLTKLQAIPCATVSTANQLQAFRDNGTSGSSKFFADSALMATYTMAQTTEAPTTDFGYSDDNPLILQPSERIYMAQGQSVSINIIAEWADY
ncbi:MAG: hypothetical protein JNL41_10785 [Phenylobacterium sp.]|uniref:hypothetical protein n=1 Tax=Phenylobacterium sp. TaxID=1871053 RepID=UPI001A6168E5|nr:hypothetical protein [Phenylobacterium sp.]MBL8554754.1 hypothetical protein [Phenylobacterium sp.]